MKQILRRQIWSGTEPPDGASRDAAAAICLSSEHAITGGIDPCNIVVVTLLAHAVRAAKTAIRSSFVDVVASPQPLFGGRISVAPTESITNCEKA
jgi:hypothetical protein